MFQQCVLWRVFNLYVCIRESHFYTYAMISIKKFMAKWIKSESDQLNDLLQGAVLRECI